MVRMTDAQVVAAWNGGLNVVKCLTTFGLTVEEFVTILRRNESELTRGYPIPHDNFEWLEWIGPEPEASGKDGG